MDKKDFGYLIIISTRSEIDYSKMAYALALSIKNTQKDYNKVVLVTDDKSKIEKFNSPWIFDLVIEKPDLPDHWDGRSYMDQLSPFEYTVCLDADMLFLEDHSDWIEYFLNNCELYVANKSFTYRGELVTDDFYRRTFTANQLPNLYSFYTFFKRESDLCKDFFSLARQIVENPNEFSNLFLDKFKPRIIGTDEAFALSAKILDITENIAYDWDFPRVIHLKPMIQNWPWPADLVSDHAGFYFNKQGQLKIGNYQQHDIVHYVEKDKITDEVINILEEIAWKR